MAEPQSLPVESVSNPAAVAAFNALQILGFILCTTVVVTAALSRSIRRSASWFMFMIFWIVWCIQHSLLLGHQFGPAPPQALCLTQASFVYALPPACAIAGLCIVLQIVFMLLEKFYDKSGLDRRLTSTLLALPPLVYAGVFIFVLSLGLENPDKVRRSPNGMYCHLGDLPLPSLIAAGTVVLTSVIILLLEVFIFRMMYNHRLKIKQLNAGGMRAIPVALIIRVAIFSGIPMVAVGLSIWSVFRKNDSAYMNVLLTQALPATAGIIFGTQQDILSTLMFCTPSRSASQERTPEEKLNAGGH